MSTLIDDLGEDVAHTDELNSCAVCGALTDGQICDRCKHIFYNEECCD